MNFWIQKLNSKDWFCFNVNYIKVENYIDFLLRNYFSHLKITKKTKNFTFYCFDKAKVLDNKWFYQFLINVQKRFNLIFINEKNEPWIANFLISLDKYQINFEKQERLYHQIMNKVIISTKINNALFLPTFIPKHFQKEYAFLALKNKRFANFSASGSGKTIVSYMSILSLFADQKINLLVVVGPKSAKSAWFEEWKIVALSDIIHADEVFNFADKPLNYIESFKFSPFIKGKLNVVFVNFHKFQNHQFTQKFIQLIDNYKTLLVVDEAHYIKNYQGTLHINLLQLSSKLEYIHLLTGTPLPRFSTEGFYIINFLFPNVQDKKELKEHNFKLSCEETVLGGIKNLKLRKMVIEKLKLFFVRKTKQALINDGFLLPMKKIKIKIDMEQSEKFLMQKLQTSKFKIDLNQSGLEDKNKCIWIIRRMQASSYPPLLFEKLTNVFSDLTNDVSDYYDQKDMTETLTLNKKDKEIDKILEKLITEKEISNIVHKYKSGSLITQRWLKAAVILKERASEKIIIWDVFKKSMQKFQKYLEQVMPDRKTFLINGDIDTAQRERIITQFKKSWNSILIASPATISESVSLHREVNVAIYLYKNYMGAHFMQSQERIHRLVGKNEKQKQKTIYLIEAASPSIDQEISCNLQNKEREQSIFID